MVSASAIAAVTASGVFLALWVPVNRASDEAPQVASPSW